MFIKNQKFTDEDTLLEMLFDFGIGEQSAIIKGMVAEIDKELEGNDAYVKYVNSLPEQDDKDEVYAEERDLRLAEALMEIYTSFEVHSATLYGVKDDRKDELYAIDMV